MKTNMQSTSLDAYFQEIVPSLSKRHKEILALFYENPTMDFTNAEISDELSRPINTVTPRVYELMGKDDRHPQYKDAPILVENRKRKCRITGRNARAVCLSSDDSRGYVKSLRRLINEKRVFQNTWET